MLSVCVCPPTPIDASTVCNLNGSEELKSVFLKSVRMLYCNTAAGAAAGAASGAYTLSHVTKLNERFVLMFLRNSRWQNFTGNVNNSSMSMIVSFVSSDATTTKLLIQTTDFYKANRIFTELVTSCAYKVSAFTSSACSHLEEEIG